MHLLRCNYCHRVGELDLEHESLTQHRKRHHPNATREATGEFHTWTTLYKENRYFDHDK